MRAPIVLLLCAAAAAAQTPSEPLRVGVGAAERRLSLAEAVEMALRNNLEIEIQRSERAAAYQGIRAARGAFDAVLRFTPSLDSQTIPAASVLQGPGGSLTNKFFSQDLSVRQPLPWGGTQLGVHFTNNRQTTTNPFVSLNPYTTSTLFFSLTQPLVRGLATDPNRARLKISAKRADVSEQELQVRATDVITRVEEAYWNLAAARQDVEVKREAVELARAQLERTGRMIKEGVLPRVESSAAEAELQRRLDTYYSSITTLTAAENNLKTLVAGSREAEIWNDQLVPIDTAAAAPAGIVDVAESVRTALARRPELRAVELEGDIAAIQRNLAADQTRPQVNLVASYGNTGLAGTMSSTVNPFSRGNTLLAERVNQLSQRAGLEPLPDTGAAFGSVPPALVGGYPTVLSNLFSGRYQSFQAGISFDLNLRNRTAEAELAQAEIAERRVRLAKAQMEQNVAAQVRNALQALESARQRVTAAEASVRAAREKLESEVRLFENGESTNFLVLTRQNEYSDSRLRLVVARADLQKADARLEQARGTTLEAHNVALR